MVIYTEPQINETQDLVSMFTYINNVSTGLFFPIMLLGIWVISFIGLMSAGRSPARAFIFTNFLCSVIGIFLGLLGLMASTYIYFTIILLGLGLIWVKLTNSI